MRYAAPILDEGQPQAEGPRVDELVGHVLRKVVPKVGNPLVEAIFEEMSPEIGGLLKKHLGQRHVDVGAMANGLERANRVMGKIAERRRKTA